ncbi:GAF domain-containing sensor histidine kinase [Pedobacter paludis]|uniref:histidine kinase n=1 Tax=Pedobacter paludis TaxID=2203212 RepID=A0A317F2Z9_9SPHI|nr:GAF domain-containing sensor histidine kinase [Pedobacter paludis]PWS32683.1 histidine kinase [Pedobacter paludis]
MKSISKADLQHDIESIAKIPIISNILNAVCRITGMGFSAVARVTDLHWIACATNDEIGFGLGPGDELKLETTICHEIRQHRNAVVIDHVSEDSDWKNHHTPKIYGLESYISVPIILSNGDFFGTLCAIDPNPANIKQKHILDTFHLFAELIATHLNVVDDLSVAEAKMQEQAKEAELREQFIAMLGHDLRNPVTAISNAVELQLRGKMDERNLRLAKIIQDATLRTRGLIDNILDFASGKLGSGIKLDFNNPADLETTLKQVITEFRLASPEVPIALKIAIDDAVKADHKRIAQLFSNLLGNAISHGTKGKPVEVEAKSSKHTGLEISVTNVGEPIDELTLKHLFKPFSRGKIRPGQEGLGLGLFIASEIAKAHHGAIEVRSSDSKIRFTFKIPHHST